MWEQRYGSEGRRCKQSGSPRLGTTQNPLSVLWRAAHGVQHRSALQTCLEEVQKSSHGSGTCWGHLSSAAAKGGGQNVTKCSSSTICLPVPSQWRFAIGKFMHNGEINPLREGRGSSLKRKQNLWCGFHVHLKQSLGLTCPVSWKLRSSRNRQKLLHVQKKMPDCIQCGTWKFAVIWKQAEKHCSIQHADGMTGETHPP